MAGFEKVGRDDRDSLASGEACPTLIPTGPELPVLPKKLMDKIVANQYVNFNELPPVKGKGRSVNQAFDSQVVIVQAADLMQNRPGNMVPMRVPELMAYLSIIMHKS